MGYFGKSLLKLEVKKKSQKKRKKRKRITGWKKAIFLVGIQKIDCRNIFWAFPWCLSKYIEKYIICLFVSLFVVVLLWCDHESCCSLGRTTEIRCCAQTYSTDFDTWLSVQFVTTWNKWRQYDGMVTPVKVTSRGQVTEHAQSVPSQPGHWIVHLWCA